MCEKEKLELIENIEKGTFKKQITLMYGIGESTVINTMIN